MALAGLCSNVIADGFRLHATSPGFQRSKVSSFKAEVDSGRLRQEATWSSTTQPARCVAAPAFGTIKKVSGHHGFIFCATRPTSSEPEDAVPENAVPEDEKAADEEAKYVHEEAKAHETICGHIQRVIREAKVMEMLDIPDLDP